jgi:hypothetical protein
MPDRVVSLALVGSLGVEEAVAVQASRLRRRQPPMIGVPAASRARPEQLPSGLADRPVAVGVVPTQAQFAVDALRWRWRPSLRLMRLRVSNPALIPDLLEFLRSRVDVVAEEVSDNEVDVSLVGSYNADAMNIELYLRVRAWEAGRRSTGVEVELID